jgi:hypothetical protein
VMRISWAHAACLVGGTIIGAILATGHPQIHATIGYGPTRMLFGLIGASIGALAFEMLARLLGRR